MSVKENYYYISIKNNNEIFVIQLMNKPTIFLPNRQGLNSWFIPFCTQRNCWWRNCRTHLSIQVYEWQICRTHHHSHSCNAVLTLVVVGGPPIAVLVMSLLGKLLAQPTNDYNFFHGARICTRQ